MARIRTIKPEMAKHELLYELEQELQAPVRFAWAMLPTQCDREGRFKWRPNALKSDILPYDSCDFSRVLHAWVTRGMLVRYRVGDAWFGWLPTFRKHQVVNAREAASELPALADAEEIEGEYNQELAHASGTRAPRDTNGARASPVHARGEGKGKEQERKGTGREEEGGAGEGVPAARAQRATRIPDDFQLTESRRAIAKAEGVDPDREFARFADYWRAASGASARKHDWDATWRNWCRKAADINGGRGGHPPNGRGPYVPALTTEQIELEIEQGLRNAEGTWISSEPNPHARGGGP